MFNNWFYDYRKYVEHIVFEPWVQASENFLMRPKNYGSQYLSLVNGAIPTQSVQFSCSVVSDSFRPHELQHNRPPCPSPTLGVYSNSSPSSRWCHPAISSSVVPFSSCPQSLPASGSFPISQLCMRWPKYWSFSFSISPSNEHPGLSSFRMDWLELLAVQGILKSLLQDHNSKASFFGAQLSL